MDLHSSDQPATPLRSRNPAFRQFRSLAVRQTGFALLVAGALVVGLAAAAVVPNTAALAGAGILLCGAFLVLFSYLGVRLARSTIRTRLLVSFVLLTLVPVLGISTGSIIIGYINGRQQAISRMESVAALKDMGIRSWVNEVQNELVAAMNDEFATERASIVLNLASRDRYYETYNKAMRNRLRFFISQSALITELFLVDQRGQVVLSTDETHEDQVFIQEPGFFDHFNGVTVQIPSGPAGKEILSAVVLVPVFREDGRLLGALAGRSGLAHIEAVLSERTGLGGTGKAYLVDENSFLIAVGEEPSEIHTAGSDAVVSTRTPGSGLYPDYRGVQVVGVYRWLPEIQAGLLVEQDLAEAIRAIFATLTVNLSIAFGAVILAIIASLFITRSIATPLEELVETATHIAAGELDRTARVAREDEVGALAKAFNSMTGQLRDLITGLEQRVAERTEALQRRALQLETSAQVSRQATSILSIDDLLVQVVELIRDAFGYYHVFIHMVDPGANRLVCRACSDQVIPETYSLEIGPGSINGEAAQSNQAILVNDVRMDTRYLPEDRVRETRAELVIPLRVGNQVIGTLDVQSSRQGSFSSEDVLVLQSLGDQIAIAIENARLYEQSRELAVLEERNRLARELHDSVIQSLYSLSLLAEGWRRLANAGSELHVEEYLRRFGEITQQALKEMRLLVYEMRPPVLEQEGLIGALRLRLDAVEQRSGVEVRLIADNLVELSPVADAEVYWIAQEALNNALKHAEASAVTIHTYLNDHQVVFEFSDNGCGFDPAAAPRSGGMGLANMAARAKKLGGSLEIVTKPGQGTTIRVQLAAVGSKEAFIPGSPGD